MNNRPHNKTSTAKYEYIFFLLTGGTDGVGKETAMELAKRGAKIIVPSRNMQKGKKCFLLR